MKWKKFFMVDFIVSVILSFGFMIWSRIKWEKFVCGYPVKECTLKAWLTQTIVILVVVFIILFIVALAWNVIFGKKRFVDGIATKETGEQKASAEHEREEAIKKMNIKPKKVIRI